MEWEEIAKQDRRRYEREKLMYKGPWKLPVAASEKNKKKRYYKDPLAPKIPPSAFLLFSSSNRSKVKSENENSTYVELTRILATMWKEACPREERRKYIDEELRLRQDY